MLSRQKNRSNIRGIKQVIIVALFLLFWVLFILFMSTRTYQQQTIRPLLIQTVQKLDIDFELPDIRISYGGHTNSLRNNPYGFTEFVFRKCAHMFVYGILTLAAHMILKKRWGPALKVYWVPLVITLLIACADEFLQRFSAGRTPSFDDVLLDLTGGCIAILLYVLVQYVQHKRKV
ncbi:VanZ family protein [Paenibacillus sp. PDC88]|uniref:VanZ family protein n=1 Tax=Paenibacillus sp. PDC88 TaxID=1884375 RepID=UPI000895D0D4|nr:VanZ family protein [Paenibacillus sp. PDC88]SDX31206.1 VanZ like family protein [Paenibacillus sp. PDC88]